MADLTEVSKYLTLEQIQLCLTELYCKLSKQDADLCQAVADALASLGGGGIDDKGQATLRIGGVTWYIDTDKVVVAEGAGDYMINTLSTTFDNDAHRGTKRYDVSAKIKNLQDHLSGKWSLSFNVTSVSGLYLGITFHYYANGGWKNITIDSGDYNPQLGFHHLTFEIPEATWDLNYTPYFEFWMREGIGVTFSDVSLVHSDQPLYLKKNYDSLTEACQSDEFAGTWFYVRTTAKDDGYEEYPAQYTIDGANGKLSLRDYVIWTGSRLVHIPTFEAKASDVLKNGMYDKSGGVDGLMSSTDKAYLAWMVDHFHAANQNAANTAGFYSNNLTEHGLYGHITSGRPSGYGEATPNKGNNNEDIDFFNLMAIRDGKTNYTSQLMINTSDYNPFVYFKNRAGGVWRRLMAVETDMFTSLAPVNDGKPQFANWASELRWYHINAWSGSPPDSSWPTTGGDYTILNLPGAPGASSPYARTQLVWNNETMELYHRSIPNFNPDTRSDWNNTLSGTGNPQGATAWTKLMNGIRVGASQIKAGVISKDHLDSNLWDIIAPITSAFLWQYMGEISSIWQLPQTAKKGQYWKVTKTLEGCSFMNPAVLGDMTGGFILAHTDGTVTDIADYGSQIYKFIRPEREFTFIPPGYSDSYGSWEHNFSDSGVRGFVPMPSEGDSNKFLRGDGTWAEVSGGASPTNFKGTISSSQELVAILNIDNPSYTIGDYWIMTTELSGETIDHNGPRFYPGDILVFIQNWGTTRPYGNQAQFYKCISQLRSFNNSPPEVFGITNSIVTVGSNYRLISSGITMSKGTNDNGIVIGAKDATYGGIAMGTNATCQGDYSYYGKNGGAAIGPSAAASNGGAIGAKATTTHGGAVGSEAKSTLGFSGGYNAQSTVDAIQLGTGTNTQAGTLKVYNYQVTENQGGTTYLSDVGKRSDLRIGQHGTIVNAINLLAAKATVSDLIQSERVIVVDLDDSERTNPDGLGSAAVRRPVDLIIVNGKAPSIDTGGYQFPNLYLYPDAWDSYTASSGYSIKIYNNCDETIWIKYSQHSSGSPSNGTIAPHSMVELTTFNPNSTKGSDFVVTVLATDCNVVNITPTTDQAIKIGKLSAKAEMAKYNLRGYLYPIGVEKCLLKDIHDKGAISQNDAWILINTGFGKSNASLMWSYPSGTTDVQIAENATLLVCTEVGSGGYLSFTTLD